MPSISTKVALLKNFPLRNDYNTAIYFSSLAEKTGYFSRVHSLTIPTTEATFAGASNHIWTQVNKPFGSVLRTSIEIGLTGDDTSSEYNKYNIKPSEMMMVNYLIATSQDNNAEEGITHYYYFVTGIKQTTVNSWNLTLELDVVTTYSPFSFTGDIMAERKHSSRFTKETDPVLGFNYRFRTTDGILLPDDIDPAFNSTVPYVKETPEIHYSTEATTHTAINTMLNGQLWLYMWFKESAVGSISGKAIDETLRPYSYTVSDPTGFNQYCTGVYCIFAPFSHSRIQTTGDEELTNEDWSASSLMFYMGKDPNLLSVQISPVSPFNIGSLTSTSVTVHDTNKCQLNFTADTIGTALTGTNQIRLASGQTYNGTGFPLLCGYKPDNLVANDFWGYGAFFHTTTALTTSTARSMTREPKLFTPPYFKMNLRTQYNGGIVYNPVALWAGTSTSPTLNLVKIPDPSQDGYFACLSKTGSIYASQKELNIGLSFQEAYQLPTGSTVFETYIATRPNFLLQAGVDIFAKAGMGAMAGGAGGAVVGAIKGIGDTLFTIDNMRNAPDTINIKSNNLLHDLCYGNYMGFYVEYFELEESKKIQADDYFYRYGYRVNSSYAWGYSTTATDKMMTRQRFNYVKLKDDSLYSKFTNTGVATEVKIKICDILSQGITLWSCPVSGALDSTLFNDSYENLEIYL